jgi:type IV secretory pathway VirB10-like protein
MSPKETNEKRRAERHSALEGRAAQRVVSIASGIVSRLADAHTLERLGQAWQVSPEDITMTIANSALSIMAKHGRERESRDLDMEDAQTKERRLSEQIVSMAQRLAKGTSDDIDGDDSGCNVEEARNALAAAASQVVLKDQARRHRCEKRKRQRSRARALKAKKDMLEGMDSPDMRNEHRSRGSRDEVAERGRHQRRDDSRDRHRMAGKKREPEKKEKKDYEKRGKRGAQRQRRSGRIIEIVVMTETAQLANRRLPRRDFAR